VAQEVVGLLKMHNLASYSIATPARTVTQHHLRNKGRSFTLC